MLRRHDTSGAALNRLKRLLPTAIMQARTRLARHCCARNGFLLEEKQHLTPLQLLIAPYLAVPMTPALTQVPTLRFKRAV